MELVLDLARADPEDGRRLRRRSTARLERLQDREPLELVDGGAGDLRRPLRLDLRREPCGRWRRSMRGSSQSTTARSITFSSSRTLPGQSYVARSSSASSSNPVDALAVLLGVAAEEEARERRDVLAPIAQRRDLDRDHVEAVEEVFAESPFGDARPQVAVGRGDDADVDLERLVAADALERPLLQEAKELHLRRRRDLADLVEEERAAVGLLEAALAPRDARR